MTSADRKLIAIVIVLALLGFLGSYAYQAMQSAKAVPTQVVIKAEGKVIKTVVLSDDTVLSFLVMGKLGNEKVEINGKKVRIVESPCPDQVCVKQGWISSPGQSIICVPGNIIVYIQGESTVDAILR